MHWFVAQVFHVHTHIHIRHILTSNASRKSREDWKMSLILTVILLRGEEKNRIRKMVCVHCNTASP